MKVLLRGLPAPVIDKVALQSALWPAMRRRLDRHLRSGAIDAVPVARILQMSMEMASTSFRRSVGLRV